jgi:hypothetical protein
MQVVVIVVNEKRANPSQIDHDALTLRHMLIERETNKCVTRLRHDGDTTTLERRGTKDEAEAHYIELVRGDTRAASGIRAAGVSGAPHYTRNCRK